MVRTVDREVGERVASPGESVNFHSTLCTVRVALGHVAVLR